MKKKNIPTNVQGIGKIDWIGQASNKISILWHFNSFALHVQTPFVSPAFVYSVNQHTKYFFPVIC